MSEVKVNKISPRSGTEVTLGDSGDTFTIPSGATINNQGTATNFGATGSASWNTTVKTSTFTAVAGEGYFVNTTGGAVSVNLPAGTAGAVVAVKDYANTFDTNAVTLVQNGSDKIGGSTVNATLDVEGIAVTLVFIDSTRGWLVTDSGLESEAPTAQFITATGGTITTVCTNFKVHTFTGPGTFTVCSAGNAAGSNTVDYVVVAGGGGGGVGGGGGGGFRESPGTTTSYTASPLGTSPAVALPVTATGFPITVGGAGAKSTGTNNGSNGGNSIFSTITAAGGGGAAPYKPSGGAGAGAGSAGGSGGGGGAIGTPSNTEAGGAGNTPPVNPSQGNSGGAGSYDGPTHTGGGGGGGAAAVGQNAPGAGSPTTSSAGGLGGNGVTTSITGSAVARSGGGGGGVNTTGNSGPFPGGTGGGGAGISPPGGTATAGTTNTGGGGGGGSPGGCKSANGGSGIVVIRYKFQ